MHGQLKNIATEKLAMLSFAQVLWKKKVKRVCFWMWTSLASMLELKPREHTPRGRRKAKTKAFIGPLPLPLSRSPTHSPFMPATRAIYRPACVPVYLTTLRELTEQHLLVRIPSSLSFLHSAGDYPPCHVLPFRGGGGGNRPLLYAMWVCGALLGPLTRP